MNAIPFSIEAWRALYEGLSQEARDEVDYLVDKVAKGHIRNMGPIKAFELIGVLYWHNLIQPWLSGYRAGYRIIEGAYTFEPDQ